MADIPNNRWSTGEPYRVSYPVVRPPLWEQPTAANTAATTNQNSQPQNTAEAISQAIPPLDPAARNRATRSPMEIRLRRDYESSIGESQPVSSADIRPSTPQSIRTEQTNLYRGDGQIGKREAVQALLNDFNTLRIGVGMARGRGNMSASMAALRVLVEKAPDKNYQVVYEKGAENSLAAILGAKNLDTKKNRQYVQLHGKKILFVREGCLTAKDKPAGPILGFVGANDAPDQHARRWLSTLGNETAGKVRAVGVGQPFAWDYGGPQCVLFPGEKVKYLDGIEKGYPLYVPELDGAGIKELLKQMPVDTQSRINKKASIAEMFDLVMKGEIDVLPIYGLHHPKMKWKGRDEDLITNICGGIKNAHKHGLEQKPVVLVVIGDRKNITKFDTKKNESRYKPDAVYDAWETGVYKKIRAHKDSEKILLLYAGNLKQEIFEQVFLKGTFPAVVEGANSADLCQKLPGKTYLHMSLDGTNFPSIDDTAEDETAIRRGKDRVTALSVALEANKREDRHDVRRNFGRVLFDSRNPDSSVRKYFNQVNQEASQRDQVVDVLYPIAQKLGFAPMEEEPRTMLMTTESSKREMQYELWSDGDLYCQKPGEDEKKKVNFKIMKPTDPKQETFSQDHWESFVDLRVTKITLDPERNPLLQMIGPRKEEYEFLYSEQERTLTLTTKNNNKLERPRIYNLKSEAEEKPQSPTTPSSPSVRKKDKRRSFWF